jgi:ElaB/YqjD/DUF883 family membrane-anchored ribosome-binding protein
MSQRQKKNGKRNIDTRIGALRSDMNALQADMEGLAGDATAVASDRAKAALRNAESVASRAIRLAEETAQHVVDDVETWGNDNLDSARESIRDQPLSALFLSLGIGAIIGAVFLRR